MKIIRNSHQAYTKLFCTMLFALAVCSSALAQDSNPTQQKPDYRFSLETNVGLALSNGAERSAQNWLENIIRSAVLDVEVGMRFPLAQTATSLYIGVQGTSFSSKSEETKYSTTIWNPTTGAMSNADFVSSLRSRFTINGGIETQLTSSLISRTTLGIGVMATSPQYRYENAPKIDETGFTMTLRQSVMYDFQRFMVGGKFEQTFSRYDNFATIGLVLGIRF